MIEIEAVIIILLIVIYILIKEFKKKEGIKKFAEIKNLAERKESEDRERIEKEIKYEFERKELNSFIIECLSLNCRGKSRVTLPLKGKVIKCKKCNIKFHIRVNDNNKPYIIEINNEELERKETIERERAERKETIERERKETIERERKETIEREHKDRLYKETIERKQREREHLERKREKNEILEGKGKERQKNINSYIIKCLSCPIKIRVTLPLKGEIIKCAKCNTRFNVKVNEDNKPYIIEINNEEKEERKEHESELERKERKERLKLVERAERAEYGERIKKEYKEHAKVVEREEIIEKERKEDVKREESERKKIERKKRKDYKELEKLAKVVEHEKFEKFKREERKCKYKKYKLKREEYIAEYEGKEREYEYEENKAQNEYEESEARREYEEELERKEFEFVEFVVELEAEHEAEHECRVAYEYNHAISYSAVEAENLKRYGEEYDRKYDDLEYEYQQNEARREYEEELERVKDKEEHNIYRSNKNIPLTSKQQEIKKFIEDRNIRELVHFTRYENIESILENGLVERDELSNLSNQFYVNDRLRLDGHQNSISLSISLPNYKMFYKYRMNTETKGCWVVLILSPDILWSYDCVFCKHNAADSRISNKKISDLDDVRSLREMFSDHNDGVDSRLEQRLMSYDPTDVQAEILVFNKILKKYIIAISFENQNLLNDVKNKNKNKNKYGDIKLMRDNKYFSSRGYIR